MKSRNIQSILKKQLLCYGLIISEESKKYILENGLYISHNKSVHACVLMFPNGSYVNVIIGEEFCKNSPFLLDIINDQLFILNDGHLVSQVFLEKEPEWYRKYTQDNVLMSTVLSLHGANTLAFTSHNECCFKLNGKGCLFCSSNQGNDIDWKIQAERICEILKYASEENKVYSLALSGGTRIGDDRGILYFSHLVDYIKKIFPDMKISVETVPSKHEYLQNLIDAGVSSIIMNLELFSDEMRKKYCPGKSEIQIEEYYVAYEFIISKLGLWKAGSVLIAGLEPVNYTIMGAKKLIDLGVRPTIMPFRPYDLSVLRNEMVTDYKTLIFIDEEIHKYIKDKNICISKAFGCLSCNACIANEM